MHRLLLQGRCVEVLVRLRLHITWCGSIYLITWLISRDRLLWAGGMGSPRYTPEMWIQHHFDATLHCRRVCLDGALGAGHVLCASASKWECRLWGASPEAAARALATAQAERAWLAQLAHVLFRASIRQQLLTGACHLLQGQSAS